MKIILANGHEQNPIMAVGCRTYVQGASRDAISFIYPEDTLLDEIDAIFTAENCERITIVEGDAEYIHTGYTVRAELSRLPVVVKPATDTEEEVVENRVSVTMAQRTYTESQVAEMQSGLAALAGMEV